MAKENTAVASAASKVTAAIITVPDTKAKIKCRVTSTRYKRLALLLQSSGKSVREYYKECNEKVGGNVSKKLLVVAVKQGLVKLANKDVKGPVLTEEDMNRYNQRKKK